MEIPGLAKCALRQASNAGPWCWYTVHVPGVCDPEGEKRTMDTVKKYLQPQNIWKILVLVIVAIIFVISFMTYQRLSRGVSYIVSYQGYIADNLTDIASDAKDLRKVLGEKADGSDEAVSAWKAAEKSIKDTTVDKSPMEMYASVQLVRTAEKETEQLASSQKTLSSDKTYKDLKSSIDASIDDLDHNIDKYNENVLSYDNNLNTFPLGTIGRRFMNYRAAYFFTEDGQPPAEYLAGGSTSAEGSTVASTEGSTDTSAEAQTQ